MSEIFRDYLNNHPMIIGVIAMIGIILFFALIFWALDIAMQEFHQPYFNYVITDGKKSAIAFIWYASHGGGHYRSFRFEMTDDKWVLSKDDSNRSGIKFVMILLVIGCTFAFIKNGDYSFSSFLVIIVFLLYFLIFFFLCDFFEKSKAKRVFKKMLLDENRYCHYKYNDTEV